ncbi:MAG: polysaccharide biosynthesis/export family protein [Nostocaceae cyanobacterium]|nr:polysaccharide biosynthesis/export family protein [Nostocaceae cyanobacterium]
MTPSFHIRVFSTLCCSLQVGVFLATGVQPVVAQSLPIQELLPAQSPELLPAQPPTPPPDADVFPGSSTGGISPLFNRYILGPGDGLGVQVQRPPGPYRLGEGDGISVAVQRFPDLSFQAGINPEGNIVVPLLGTVSLQGLTLKQAEDKIRLLLNRYVVDPIVVLSLVGQRPDLSFQAGINPEGNILVPRVGTISLQGLTVQEAQEKIRLSLSRILVDPVVVVSLISPRPVRITISGEITRPGIYPIGSQTPRITEALLLAGGSSMMADLRQVQVRRQLVDGSVISQTIDLYTPLQNGGSPPELRLQDGDAIIVPRRELGNNDDYDRNLVARSSLAVSQIRVRVLNNAVGGLSTVVLPNGSNFIDALSGVSTNNAKLRSIALIRFDPERGRAITQKLDAKKALAGDASQNVALQDNDVIVIGATLIGRITRAINNILRPFFDVRTFLRFFDDFR